MAYQFITAAIFQMKIDNRQFRLELERLLQRILHPTG